MVKSKVDYKLYVWLGVGLVVLLTFVGGCSSYNSLVQLDETVSEAWGNVEAQYQRRMDMFKNLNATVAASAKNEKGILTEVTRARAGIDSLYNEAFSKQDQANNWHLEQPSQKQLDDYVAAQESARKAIEVYVNAVKEAYPTITSNEAFTDLQAEITGTENRVSYARTKYNEAVKEYNVKRRSFPTSMFAGMFGFENRAQFQADPGASAAPSIEFN